MADQKPIIEKGGQLEGFDESTDRLDIRLTNERLPQKTGIIRGWVPSIDTGTTIDLTAGKGWLVDNETDPEAPVYTFQDTAPNVAVAVLNVGTETFTYFYFDAAGTLTQQNSPPLRSEYRTKQFVCVTYQPLGTVEAVYPIGQSAFEGDFYAYDTFESFGVITTGNVYDRATSAPLELKVSSGDMAYPNANRQDTVASRRDNHHVQQLAVDPILSFTYVNNDGADGISIEDGAATEIDTLNRSNGIGGITALANNRSGLCVVYRDPKGNTVVEYTVAEFNPSSTTAEEAFEAAISLQPLVMTTPFQELYVVEYPRGAADLDLCTFHRVGQTGGFGGSSNPGSSTTNSEIALTITSPHAIGTNTGTIFSPSVSRNVTELVVQAGAETSGSGGSFTFELFHGPNLGSLVSVGAVTVTQGTQRATNTLGAPVTVPANDIFVVDTTAIGAFPISTSTKHKRFYFHVRMTPP